MEKVKAVKAVKVVKVKVAKVKEPKKKRKMKKRKAKKDATVSFSPVFFLNLVSPLYPSLVRVIYDRFMILRHRR